MGYIGKIKKKGKFIQYDLSYLYSENNLGIDYYYDDPKHERIMQRQVSLSIIGGLHKYLTKDLILFGGAGGFINGAFKLKDVESGLSLAQTSVINYGVSLVMGLEFPKVAKENLFQISIYYDIGLKKMANFDQSYDRALAQGIRARNVGVSLAYSLVISRIFL